MNVCVLILCVTQFVFALQADDLLEDVQSKYEKAKTIYIQFKQSTSFKLTDLKSETTGEFSYKKDHSYKFETDERIWMANGTDTWEYNKTSEQVIINDYNPESGSPKDFLFSYQKNYHAEFVKEDGELQLIKLFPKEGVRTSNEYLMVWIDEDKSVIKKIDQIKINGNVVSFDILSIKFDSKMNDSDFVFQTDDSKHHIVDMRF